MPKYIIEGGNPLKGTINISGNKNSVLPALAATLLTDKRVTLTNVPNISDVKVLVDILRLLGAKVDVESHKISVEAKNIKTHILPEDLVNKLRASVLLSGPMLARVKKVEFSHPGGDIIGKRSIQTHINGLAKLGVEFSQSDRRYKAKYSKTLDKDVEIFLDEPSVTATENLLMFAAKKPSKTILKNCALEPHVIDVCKLLGLMGAQIKGAGTSTIEVFGKDSLDGAEFRIGQDFVEVGTYAVASAITKGEVYLKNSSLEDLEPITHPLSKMGITFEEKPDGILVSSKKIRHIERLTTNNWPGFPTDLMSAVIVLATQANGVSLLHDWMYESRMFFVDKLISMGANITIADPHRVFVYGPTRLHAREMESPDIRAGMALVLAALIAKGESVINKADLIERGYEDVVGNLSKLGANIKRAK